jgi:hypothetical protein
MDNCHPIIVDRRGREGVGDRSRIEQIAEGKSLSGDTSMQVLLVAAEPFDLHHRVEASRVSERGRRRRGLPLIRHHIAVYFEIAIWAERRERSEPKWARSLVGKGVVDHDAKVAGILERGKAAVGMTGGVDREHPARRYLIGGGKATKGRTKWRAIGDGWPEGKVATDSG